MATAVAPTPMYIYIIGKLSTIGVNVTVGLTLTVSMHGTIVQCTKVLGIEGQKARS